MREQDSALIKYLVVVLLHEPTHERVVKVVPAIQKVLKAASVSDPEIAFRAKNNEVFGYLIKSSLAASAIHSRLETPGGRFDSKTPAILDGRDAVLVVEIGNRFTSSAGLGRVATWLQRK